MSRVRKRTRKETEEQLNRMYKAAEATGRYNRITFAARNVLNRNGWTGLRDNSGKGSKVVLLTGGQMNKYDRLTSVGSRNRFLERAANGGSTG